MGNPVILLVESDNSAVQSIVAAFDRRLIPRPVHVTSGEEAVLWIKANACDACLLSYQLPGIDGLETFARIRQRASSLPVVMLSGTESEQVAVAAFRAGVADYVPRQAGYQDVAAQKIQQLINQSSGSRSAASAESGVDASDVLLRPTYQNRLRAIGRQLDLYNHQSINLMEVGGGILVRASSAGSRSPEALEFVDADFSHLLRGGIAARGEGERPRSRTKLVPTGYEDFLRAVGYRLDQLMAAAVTITELDEFFAIGGVGSMDRHGHAGIGPIQMLLYADDITFILDEAYRRRAPEPEVKSSGIGRFLGRQRD